MILQREREEQVVRHRKLNGRCQKHDECIIGPELATAAVIAKIAPYDSSQTVPEECTDTVTQYWDLDTTSSWKSDLKSSIYSTPAVFGCISASTWLFSDDGDIMTGAGRKVLIEVKTEVCLFYWIGRISPALSESS